MLCIATSFSYSANPSLLSWLTANLRNTSATTLAVPLNVTLGTIGQIIGEVISGSLVTIILNELCQKGIYIYKPQEAPGYPTGHFTNAAFLLEASAVVLVLRAIYARRNRSLAVGEKPWSL